MASPNTFAALLRGETPPPTPPRRSVPALHETETKRVRRMIMEARGSEYLTLSPVETRILQRLLSERSSDHELFRQGGFTADDFERLGLQTEEEAEGFVGKGDWKPPGEGEEASNGAQFDGEVRLFTPVDAVIAPNVTPGHDQPIPPDVVRALEVLQRPVQPQPQPGAAPVLQEPAPAPPAGAPSQPVATAPGAPPAPQQSFEARAMALASGKPLVEVAPAPPGTNPIAAALSAHRQRQKASKARRKGKNRIDEGSDDESKARQTARAKIGELGAGVEDDEGDASEFISQYGG